METVWDFMNGLEIDDKCFYIIARAYENEHDKTNTKKFYEKLLMELRNLKVEEEVKVVEDNNDNNNNNDKSSIKIEDIDAEFDKVLGEWASPFNSESESELSSDSDSELN